MIFVQKIIFHKTYFSVLLLIVFVAYIFPTNALFAAPPTTRYAPGETLNPTCAPTDTNCGVDQIYVNPTTLQYGIGTSTPYSKLTLWGAGTGTGKTFEVANHASTTLFSLLDNGLAYFLGNLGVGTTTPAQPLSINGKVYATGGYQFGDGTVQTTAATAGTNYWTLLGNNIYNNNNGGLGSVGIGTTTPWGLLSINPNGITGPSFAIGSSTATNFVVTNGGNVGIGTAAPAYKLDVNGDINVVAGSAYKLNGANVIRAQTTLNNYFFGGAGNLTMTGSYNTAQGLNALSSNTTSSYNTANGAYALFSNTSAGGGDNSAFGA